jgi:phenylalanyl-tRNA synthetase beta chain
MKTSLSWIKSYIPDLNVSLQEYVDGMTLSGTNVEGVEVLDENLDKIVIGQIEKLEKHPDAEKLLVSQVNVGDEVIQIVTGAPNVKEGDKVPIVLVGGSVVGGRDGIPIEGGMKIKAGKLRGVESFGMMCSIEELGSTSEMYPEAPEDGIYIFPEDAVIGADAIEVLGFRDALVEYEVTSNRADCFSVNGIAREAAATFRKKYNPVVIKETGNDEEVTDYVNVTVEDEILCPRFLTRAIKNVKIAPSPQWLRMRLASVGIRPINNMVDITNYVMEEFGQPMHAYDLEKIADQHIIVKRANKGDTFKTLDGIVRPLDEDTLMICDSEKAIGIAGIMGGENTMITDDVHTMALEVANFDGVNIRKSSKKIGLRTDASGKFEKGLDPHNAILAMNRACQLIEELGAGEIVGGIIDVSTKLKEPLKIPFNLKEINNLLGTELSQEETLELLAPIELIYDESDNTIVVPTFRQDIERGADIAEEVARFYGYDKIPSTLPKGEATTGRLPFKLRVEQIIRNVVEHAGFSESLSYSFESPKVFDKLLLEKDSPLRDAIEISNPLGEDFSVMRTTSVNGLLVSLGTNYKRRNKNVALYEIGNVYLSDELPITKLPDERTQITLGFYGDGDFFTMKGVIEQIFGKLGMAEKAKVENKGKRTFLHPGRQGEINYQDVSVGYLGEVHPRVATAYGIGEKALIAVIELPSILPFVTFDRKYREIPKYPAVNRDISMTIGKEVLVSEIEDVITSCAGDYLESLALFDIYEGSQIPEGLKSVAYSIIFRAKDKTLEEGDISKAMDNILKGLEELGAQLRK